MQICYSSYHQCKSFNLPRLGHSPSLCPSSTVVPRHHIFAGKSLPMASVSNRCGKFGQGEALEHGSVVCCAEGCPTARGLVPTGPAWKREALRPLTCPMGNTLLWNTPGTSLFLTGREICCLESQMSKSSLDEKSLPVQCHKGTQSYSGGGEVSTVILWSFTYKTLPKETWRIEDSFSWAAKLKNL